jgi:hypothetical protein
MVFFERFLSFNSLNVQYHVYTVVKYTKVLLTAKNEMLMGTLKDLEMKAKLVN